MLSWKRRRSINNSKTDGAFFFWSDIVYVSLEIGMVVVLEWVVLHRRPYFLAKISPSSAAFSLCVFKNEFMSTIFCVQLVAATPQGLGRAFWWKESFIGIYNGSKILLSPPQSQYVLLTIDTPRRYIEFRHPGLLGRTKLDWFLEFDQNSTAAAVDNPKTKQHGYGVVYIRANHSPSRKFSDEQQHCLTGTGVSCVCPRFHITASSCGGDPVHICYGGDS